MGITEERQPHYGDAWLWANTMLAVLPQENITHLLEAGYLNAVLQILQKICRASVSPDILDHWVDIAGYAELVRADVDKFRNPYDEENS